MVEKTENITSGKIMHRIYDSEIYNEIIETNVNKHELTNHQLIKQLISRSDILHSVILFINGKSDMKSALEEFTEKINPLIKRYEHIHGVGERLFFAVAIAIKEILNIKKEINEQIEQLLKSSPEEAEMEADSEVKLEKENPISLKKAKQLQIIIERSEEMQNHDLNILKKDNYLEVWCSTADSDEGKKMILTIEKNSEYSIGQAEQRIIKIAKEKLEKAKEDCKKAKSEYQKFYTLSTVSTETEEAKETVERAKAREQIAKFELDKLMENPLQHWFTAEKSPDISKDHIIIEFTGDGSIVITDEGEECSANLVRVE